MRNLCGNLVEKFVSDQSVEWIKRDVPARDEVEKIRAGKGWAVKRARPSEKGVMQWTGILLRNVAYFRLRSALAMWFVH